MSIIGDFTVPAESFALHHATTAVPEMTVEADRLATHSSTEVLPFVWATGGDFESFRRALDDDPTVVDVDVAEETASETLYRIEWDDEFVALIDDMVDHHAGITEARARDDQWNLRLRFADEGMVTTFQSHFEETGRRFEVNQLVRPRKARQRIYGLTEEQYEALAVAARNGYFSVPRSFSIEELGGHLGISANAASQRIRRGSDTLVRSTLQTDDPERDRPRI